MTPLPRAFLDKPIAHRALHDIKSGRPENSREAILAAIDAGYSIEIDVQLSGDGQAIVFHDYDLLRLTGRQGLVADFTAAKLAEMTLLGGSTGPATLPDILALIDGRVPLLIEIKDQSEILGETDGLLESATCKALERYTGDVALMSFNPHAVAHCKRLRPDISRGLVTDPFNTTDWPNVPKPRLDELVSMPDYTPLKCAFISHNQSDLNAPQVKKMRDQGATILCWTVTSPAADKQARRVAHNVTFEGYLA